jgi:hypothetical protein
MVRFFLSAEVPGTYPANRVVSRDGFSLPLIGLLKQATPMSVGVADNMPR